jgi:LuxR family transcriptional regulator, activator of conjugal transfer of Ti plasmids
MSKGFQEFIDTLKYANDEFAVAMAASRMCDAYGFRWFTYLGANGKTVEFLSSYPVAWGDHYLKKAFERIDPVVARSHAADGAFFWGEGTDVYSVDNASRNMFGEAAQFGIRNGVTVPIRGPGKHVSAFTVSGGDRVMQGHKSSREILDLLQMSALHLHACMTTRVPRFMTEQGRSLLTNRQRYCLTQSSKGHSAKMIARHAGLTPRTVEFHLEEAKRRLHAATLPQAVAIAIEKKLIALTSE